MSCQNLQCSALWFIKCLDGSVLIAYVHIDRWPLFLIFTLWSLFIWSLQAMSKKPRLYTCGFHQVKTSSGFQVPLQLLMRQQHNIWCFGFIKFNWAITITVITEAWDLFPHTDKKLGFYFYFFCSKILIYIYIYIYIWTSYWLHFSIQAYDIYICIQIKSKIFFLFT